MCSGPGTAITQDICFSTWGGGKKKKLFSRRITKSFSANITSSLKGSSSGQTHLDDDKFYLFIRRSQVISAVTHEYSRLRCLDHCGHYTCMYKSSCAAVCVCVPQIYSQACAEPTPPAWRGPAACPVRRLAAVVCVCSACGAGRTGAPGLVWGQPERQRGSGQQLRFC